MPWGILSRCSPLGATTRCSPWSMLPTTLAPLSTRLYSKARLFLRPEDEVIHTTTNQSHCLREQHGSELSVWCREFLGSHARCSREA